MNGTALNACCGALGAYFQNWRFTDVLEPHVPITGAVTASVGGFVVGGGVGFSGFIIGS